MLELYFNRPRLDSCSGDFLRSSYKNCPRFSYFWVNSISSISKILLKISYANEGWKNYIISYSEQKFFRFVLKELEQTNMLLIICKRLKYIYLLNSQLYSARYSPGKSVGEYWNVIPTDPIQFLAWTFFVKLANKKKIKIFKTFLKISCVNENWIIHIYAYYKLLENRC